MVLAKSAFRHVIVMLVVTCELTTFMTSDGKHGLYSKISKLLTRQISTKVILYNRRCLSSAEVVTTLAHDVSKNTIPKQIHIQIQKLRYFA
jgi:hypothetical protein